MISLEQRPEYLAYANSVLGVDFDPIQTAWLTNLNEDGSVAAVIVFNFVTTHNAEMSIASDGKSRWATRSYMRACSRYAFNQLGLARVTAIVEDGNEKSLRMCRKLGYIHEATLKEWFGTRDGIVMRMLKRECKWNMN